MLGHVHFVSYAKAVSNKNQQKVLWTRNEKLYGNDKSVLWESSRNAHFSATPLILPGTL